MYLFECFIIDNENDKRFIYCFADNYCLCEEKILSNYMLKTIINIKMLCKDMDII
jgi:hypothetical protein